MNPSERRPISTPSSCDQKAASFSSSVVLITTPDTSTIASSATSSSFAYSRQVRAWLLEDTTGIDALRLSEVPTPEPGPEHARIRLKVAGLNHLDVWVSRGLPKPKSLPHILGADGAGVIEAVGPGVTEWHVGDETVINPSLSCGECEFCLSDQ